MMRVWIIALLLLVGAQAGAVELWQNPSHVYLYVADWSKLKHLAQLGDAEAQFQLGWRYSQPDTKGLAHSYEDAAKWYRKAALQRHSTASYNLGVMHLQGIGVDKDPLAAYVWLDLAAQQGHGKSRLVVSELNSVLSDKQLSAARELKDTIQNKMR